jgi:hypothetical protein
MQGADRVKHLNTRFLRTAAVLGALTLVGACAPTSRFEWGSYEGSLFAYTKHPEARENYRRSLKEAVASGEASHRLAPGLLAELGFLSLEDGDASAATDYFNQEMAAFPESATFLRGVIARRAEKSPPSSSPSPSPAPQSDTTDKKGQ